MAASPTVGEGRHTVDARRRGEHENVALENGDGREVESTDESVFQESLQESLATGRKLGLYRSKRLLHPDFAGVVLNSTEALTRGICLWW